MTKPELPDFLKSQFPDDEIATSSTFPKPKSEEKKEAALPTKFIDTAETLHVKTGTDSCFKIINNSQSSNREFLKAITDLFYNIVPFYDVKIAPEHMEQIRDSCWNLRNAIDMNSDNQQLQEKINDLRQALVAIVNIMAIKDAIENIIAIESVSLNKIISGVLASEVNKLIEKEHQLTGSKLTHYLETDSLFLKTEIVDKSQNFSEMIEKMQSSASLITKPIEGLYRTIIAKLFLMDPSIKFSDMYFVEENGKKYQVGNFNFCNAFSDDHIAYLQKGITEESLLMKIENIAHQRKQDSNLTYLALSLNCQYSSKKEIENTFKIIADITDKELAAAVNKLADIENINGEKLVSKQIMEECLQALIKNRDAFAKIYHANFVNKGEAKSAAPDVAQSSPSPNPAVLAANTNKESTTQIHI